MLRSLRFKLPALFLLGIVLSGLVASLLAIRFFQSYTRTRAIAELRAESVGIVQLYTLSAAKYKLPAGKLEKAIGGDHIFFVPIVPGASLVVGSLPHLPPGSVSIPSLEQDPRQTLDIRDSEGRRYLAVAQIVRLGKFPAGALVVAKPTSQLRSRWVTLFDRLAIAFGGGVLVAGLLGLYLSRRITTPLRRLSAAADAVAGGTYAVDLPEPRGGDEIAHLASRFGEMASKLAESEELSRHFLMTVSHELRTPLTAIRGHVAALREGVFDDEGARDQSLAVIGEEAMRLERLVGDVLDLAKLDARRFAVLREEVDMEQLCERVYATFGEEARRRSIDYRRQLEGRPVIVTDGDRVLQIISNLLSNAFRWTPEGGRIELGLAAANGDVSVTVSDNGPGITSEERERIFRPFWSRDGGGTGLGLAIARELAVALGGRIELESAPGRGSRFRLVLPAGGPPDS
ncbi:MAG TPA: HAMP domain-containing sensor histidine kinase [Gaiellaceae bacterium]|nr:HAMP domain-containing sensor histidine kinase [Gaiellaceae bacterium]